LLYLPASVSCLHALYAVTVSFCFLPAWFPCCTSLLPFPVCMVSMLYRSASVSCLHGLHAVLVCFSFLPALHALYARVCLFAPHSSWNLFSLLLETSSPTAFSSEPFSLYACEHYR
jgi:hypothetical protein